MISRYEAVLNGNALSAVSSDILILDISYANPALRYESYAVAKRHGARLYRKYFEKATVTITFQIRKYGITDRQAVCADIVKWAKNGGVLTTNDRPGQQLRCVCEQYPTINSVKQWTGDLQIVFAAYALPFWQSITKQSVTLTGASGSGELYLPGNVDEAFLEAKITAGGALTSVALTANGKTMTLSGLSVASGGIIEIKYNEEMIQSITNGATSLLNKRTGADDLVLKCGENNTVGFTANVSCTVELSARGLWL